MRKRDRDRKYHAAMTTATAEDFDDALELIDRLTVPLRDRALLELAGGALLSVAGIIKANAAPTPNAVDAE